MALHINQPRRHEALTRHAGIDPFIGELAYVRPTGDDVWHPAALLPSGGVETFHPLCGGTASDGDVIVDGPFGIIEANLAVCPLLGCQRRHTSTLTVADGVRTFLDVDAISRDPNASLDEILGGTKSLLRPRHWLNGDWIVSRDALDELAVRAADQFQGTWTALRADDPQLAARCFVSARFDSEVRSTIWARTGAPPDSGVFWTSRPIVETTWPGRPDELADRLRAHFRNDPTDAVVLDAIREHTDRHTRSEAADGLVAVWVVNTSLMDHLVGWPHRRHQLAMFAAVPPTVAAELERSAGRTVALDPIDANRFAAAVGLYAELAGGHVTGQVRHDLWSAATRLV